MLLLMFKLIASNRGVFNLLSHHLINIIFVFRTQVIKPIKILQRFLFRLGHIFNRSSAFSFTQIVRNPLLVSFKPIIAPLSSG